ncbi:MAG TPA: hypothetical protein VM052_07905 [Candidatus Limnocylindrales bacterium]|nr:hypothetical protein [Candidatus Limnocylindrales bacterium]
MDTQALLTEARTLGLFRPHAPFEVHCAHCHARLDGRGDCATCGLIGRADSEMEKRATVDPAGTTKLLQGAIDRRKAYRPAGREKSQER